MGLLLGLIGANILANTIGNKIVEIKEAQRNVNLRAQEEITNRTVQTETIHSSTAVDITRIQTQGEVEMARIRAGERVMVEAARQGYFTEMYNYGYPTENYISTKKGRKSTKNNKLEYAPSEYYQTERNTSSYYREVPRNSAPVNPHYQQNEYARGANETNEGMNQENYIRFCSACGKARPDGAMFCPSCGHKY